MFLNEMKEIKIKKLNDSIKNFFVTELLNIASND